MQDRQPATGKEGRVYIQPESGTGFYAVITIADGATKLGTALNKTSLLKDRTASEYGVSAGALASATPDDILHIAHGLITEALGRAHCVSGTYTGDGAQRSGGAYIKELSFDFAPKLIVITDEEVSANPCTAIVLPACLRGLTLEIISAGGNSYAHGRMPGVECSADGKQVTLASITYGSSTDPRIVMNALGRTYHYTAIG